MTSIEEIKCPCCGGNGANDKLCGFCAAMHPLSEDYAATIAELVAVSPDDDWRTILDKVREKII